MDYYGERPNYRLKALIIEVVENQMVENNPPITNITYERLTKSGYSEREAQEKTGSVVVVHIYDMTFCARNRISYKESKYRIIVFS